MTTRFGSSSIFHSLNINFFSKIQQIQDYRVFGSLIEIKIGNKNEGYGNKNNIIFKLRMRV